MHQKAKAAATANFWPCQSPAKNHRNSGAATVTTTVATASSPSESVSSRST